MSATFHIWAMPGHDGAPDIDHPIWSVPGLRPNIRPRIARPILLSENPPGTGTTYPTPTTKDAAGIAVQTANWMEYIEDQYASAGIPLLGRSLFLHQWGLASEDEPYSYLPVGADEVIPALERNYNEAVVISADPADDFAEISGPFHAFGIDACYTFSLAIAQALQTQIASRGLTMFEHCHWDVEKMLLGIDQALPAPTGWWVPALADARYSTEAIIGSSTLQSLWTSATTLAGGAVTVDTTKGAFHPSGVNDNFQAWIRNLLSQSALYSIGQSATRAFNTVFGTLPWSNYNVHACSRTNPASGNVVYAPWYEIPTLSPFTHGSIVSYGLTNDQINSRSTLALWLAYLELESSGDNTTDVEAVRLARTMSRVNAHIATAPSSGLVVWMDWPGRTESLTDIAPGFTYSVRYDAYVELMITVAERCAAAGVQLEFYIWVDDDEPESTYDRLNTALREVEANSTQALPTGTFSVLGVGRRVSWVNRA